MKAKKWLTLITFFVSMLSVIGVFLLFPYRPVWYDILLALFGSAVLGFIMSLTEYFSARRYAMESFWNEAFDCMNKLRKIKFYLPDEPTALIQDCLSEQSLNEWNVPLGNAKETKAREALISHTSHYIPAESNDYEKELDDWFDAVIQKNIKLLEECTASYIHFVDNFDLGNLGNAYGRMDFLFANPSIRQSAYDKILKAMRDIRDQVTNKASHFRLVNTGGGNLRVCINQLLELNDLLFRFDRLGANDESVSVYRKAVDELDDNLELFRAKIYNKKPDLIKHERVMWRVKPSNEKQETPL